MTWGAILLANAFIMLGTFLFALLISLEFQGDGQKYKFTNITLDDWLWMILSAVIWPIGLPIVLFYVFYMLFLH